MSIIQILIVIFSLFAITRTFRQFKKGKLTLAFLFGWMFFWVVVGVIVVLPQTTNTLARIIGVGRGVDAIIYLSIITLFYLVFRIYVKIEEGQREMTRLIRKLAVDEIDGEGIQKTP